MREIRRIQKEQEVEVKPDEKYIVKIQVQSFQNNKWRLLERSG
jgi:hypothetical protein